MPVERRGCVIAFEIGSTGNGRNPMFNGRRQPSCGGTSRMMREYQVRICERLGVKVPGPTRQSRLFGDVGGMSAHPPTAAQQRTSLEVAFGPGAGSCLNRRSGPTVGSCAAAK